MLIIKEIPNILNKDNRQERTIPYDPEKRIIDILRGLEIAYEDKNVIIHGSLIKDLKVRPRDGDEIIVNTDIGDPATIGAVIWQIGTWLVEKFVEHWITYTIMAITMAYGIYSSVSTKSKMPSFGSFGGEGMDEASPTYGWDGIVNTQEVGIPVGIIYGRHRVGGNIINQYVSTDGDKNYLNLLIALGEGEINSISSIKINENPIENFTGITTYQRLGTNSQTVIPNFEDLHSIITINQPLTKNNAYTHTTVETDTEAFEITLNLPNGLFQVDAFGAITAWAVTYQVEYKLHSAGVWTDLGSTTISGLSRTALKRTFRKDGLTAGQYDIRITRTSDNSSLDPQQTGDLYLQSVDEIVTDDLAYPNTALLGIKALATDQLSGSTPVVTSLIEGRLVNIPKIMNGASEVDWEDYYWDPATSQWKLLSDGTVLSWDGTTYVDRWCANPIWCLKDLMTNGRYGLGEYIESTYINDADFLSMAKYCEERVADGAGGYEKRFRLDCVIDSATKALDILIQICATFRAFPYFANGKISIGIDKPQTTDTQVFGMGNIEKGTFSETWKSYQETPNIIEVTFMDQDLDYKQETVVVTDETALSANAPVKKKQIRVFTTKKSYAIREGRYALYVAKYITRTLRFVTDLRAIVALPGERIGVSHDVPQWGYSGKIQSGSTTTNIKLDRSVVIEAGHTYEIMIQHGDDDTVETKLVTTSTPGTYTELTTEAFSKAPGAFSDYAFGEQNISTKPYRMIGIKKHNDGRGEITAIEYSASVYDDTAPTIPTNNYSALTVDVPDVTDLSLTEAIVKMPDGTIEDAIDVWFQKPDVTSHLFGRYKKAKIYISSDAGASYQLAGETTDTHLRILGNIKDAQTYRIVVVSISEEGKENPISTSPYDDITVVGKSASPSDVSSLAIAFASDHLEFSWSEVTDVDLWGYEIRSLPYSGASWGLGTVVATKIGGNSHNLFRFLAGSLYYAIKAIDTSGNYSTNATEASISISEISGINIIKTWEDELLSGSLSGDAEKTWIKGYSADYYRQAISFRSDILWDVGNWDDGGYWDKLFDTTTTGIYTTPVIDLGSSQECGVTLELGIANVQGGNLLIEIAYSASDSNPTNWTNFASGNYTGRYFKFRFTLSTSNENYGVDLYKIKASFDVPDKTQEAKEVSISDTGYTQITLTGFTQVNVVIVTPIEAYVPEIEKDGAVIKGLPAYFNVKLKDPADSMAQVAGKINYYVKGY